MPIKQRKLLWPVMIVMAVTITALLWVSASTKAEATPAHDSLNTTLPASPVAVAEQSLDSLPQDNSASERVETELITIQSNGFEPAEITRPEGRIRLAVDNRSGSEEVVLRLDREAGQRQREVRVSRSRLDWREVIDLTPGTYLLTEANHPGWVCRIIITRR